MTKHLKHSLFITCEGGEGAGKSTLIKSLEKELLKRGYEVVVTREPGGSALGNSIRKALLDHSSEFSIGALAELLLFLAARAQHIEEVIRPALDSGKIVLCDRFNDSSVVYQGMARGLGKEKVEGLCASVFDNLRPDLTYVLDINPLEGLSRTKKTHKPESKAGCIDRIENESFDFHEKIREGFLILAKEDKERIKVLNGSLPAADVFKEALNSLEFLIN